jgi:hypothetical protein
MKTSIRKSREVIDFMLDKIMEGMTPAAICRKYPTKTPEIKTFYNWQLKDPDLKDEISDAYYVYYQIMADELIKVSSGLASELYPGVEFREAEAALKRRMDAIKFTMGKMAPVMTNRMTAKQQVEHSGEMSSIHIVDYSTKDK